MNKPVTLLSRPRYLWAAAAVAFLYSCSPAAQLSKSARLDIRSSDALKTAHVGISVYEPATGRYWYNHQGDKYFVPASNTKIPTCYAALKYLGDSLVALRYQPVGDQLLIEPSGDPTFLQPEFTHQPAEQFL